MDQLQILSLWKQLKQSLSERYQDLKTMFQALDINESGLIEIEDLTEELQNNHNIQSESDIQQLFDFINTAKNGTISQDEFEQRWTAADQLIKQTTNKLQFQKINNQQQQNSAQQFSDLFRSSISGNSPTKYINVQDYQHYITPPKQFSPLKWDRKISPPKPEYMFKTKADISQDKFKEVQRKITRLFNNKIDPKNSTPRNIKNFQDFVHFIKFGSKQYSKPTYKPSTIRFNRASFHDRISTNNYDRSSPKSSDRVSLQQYAYQFYDRKYEHRQTFSHVPMTKTSSMPSLGSFLLWK